MRKIYVVADFGLPGDLAWAEVDGALEEKFPGVRTVPVAVPAFNTFAGGFLAAQLSRRRFDPLRTSLIINVDPRIQSSGPLQDGAGAPILGVVLRNSLRVFGPNAGHTFSFLKERIERCLTLHDGAGNGQFRTRDLIPQLMWEAWKDEFAGFPKFDRERIPDPPKESVVLYRDGFGNLKLSLTLAPAQKQGWKAGQIAKVVVNGHSHAAVCTPSIMGVKPGLLTLAPGSSGDYPDDPCLELSIRANGQAHQASADAQFGHPLPGSPVQISF